MASPVMATAWKVIQNLLNKHSLSFLVFLNPGKAKSYSIASQREGEGVGLQPWRSCATLHPTHLHAIMEVLQDKLIINC